MKPALLVNENFPAPATVVLRDEGWDVLAIREGYASLPDSQVLQLAREQNRWLLTFDQDYGDLLFKKGLPAPPAVVLLREPHYRPEEPATFLKRILEEPEQHLGFFCVLTRDTLRKRPLLKLRDGGA